MGCGIVLDYVAAASLLMPPLLHARVCLRTCHLIDCMVYRDRGSVGWAMSVGVGVGKGEYSATGTPYAG